MAGLEGEKPQGTPEGSVVTPQSTASAIDYSKIDYTKIDWSKVPVDALPEEVIKETPTAKALLQETIERRKTIKQMKEALGEKPEGEPKAAAPKSDDSMPEWAKLLMGEVQSIKQTTQQQELAKVVDAQMKERKLPETVRKFITGNNPAEIIANAAEMAKAFPQTDNTSAGAGGGGTLETVQSEALRIINERINGSLPVSDKGKSIFDTRIQSIK